MHYLSNKEKKFVRNRGKHMHTKKSLTKEAIRNKQMVATPIRKAFEDGIVCYEDRPNFEKSVDEDECRKKRKRCFTIDEHKKEEMLIKVEKLVPTRVLIQACVVRYKD
jgi:hypothetical protein